MPKRQFMSEASSVRSGKNGTGVLAIARLLYYPQLKKGLYPGHCGHCGPNNKDGFVSKILMSKGN